MERRVLYPGRFTLLLEITHRGRSREIYHTTDAVAILLYDKAGRRLILVRQPREAMINEANPDGLITEPVAGRFDCDLGVTALAVKESLEEAGVTLREDQIEVLNSGQSMPGSPGESDSRKYLCYAIVEPGQIGPNQMIFSAPGEDERTTRVFLPNDELETYVCEDLSAFALIQYHRLRLKAEEA